MKPRDLSHIRLLIFDLDGTLYPYTEEFLELCHATTVRTLMQLHPGLTLVFEKAVQMARESAAARGSSFSHLGREYNLKYDDFHHPYHDRLSADLLRPDPELIRILEKLKALGVEMVVLTNGSKGWARKALNQTELSPIFGDNIIALEDNGGRPKARCKHGFIKASNMTGIPLDLAMMIEDLERNLVIPANELNMATAHVYAQNPAGDHVHFTYPKTIMLLNQLKEDIERGMSLAAIPPAAHLSTMAPSA